MLVFNVELATMDKKESLELKPIKRGRPPLYSSPEERIEQTKAKRKAYKEKYNVEHKEDISNRRKEIYKLNVAPNHTYKKRANIHHFHSKTYNQKR